MKKNGNRIALSTSTYDIIETVVGINSIDIFPKRKSVNSSICDTLIILKNKQKKSRTRAKTLPGNGIGKNEDIISPMQHMKKTITI